jgi:hypothetical protein
MKNKKVSTLNSILIILVLFIGGIMAFNYPVAILIFILIVPFILLCVYDMVQKNKAWLSYPAISHIYRQLERVSTKVQHDIGEPGLDNTSALKVIQMIFRWLMEWCSIDMDKLKSWFLCARQPDIVLCALKMAAIVGTILMIINHGDELWLGQLTALHWIQIGLTYLVPYSVSTYSSVEIFRKHHVNQ